MRKIRNQVKVKINILVYQFVAQKMTLSERKFLLGEGAKLIGNNPFIPSDINSTWIIQLPDRWLTQSEDFRSSDYKQRMRYLPL